MSRVRFTTDSIGLVTRDEPYRFVEPIVGTGDEGELIAPPPFPVPDGWLVVRVPMDFVDQWGDSHDALFAPVDPAMIEPAT